jgi:hypothetical protein
MRRSLILPISLPDVRRRKERQATAATFRQPAQATRPATVNPYMKESSSRVASIVPVATNASAYTPTMATMGSQNHSNSTDQQSQWFSRPLGAPNHSQHPHRVGRIRASRQFGSSLQISVNPTLPVPQVNLQPTVPDETATIPGSRRRSTASGTSKRVARGVDRQRLNGDSDDSDGGDDVLGFKPFGK